RCEQTSWPTTSWAPSGAPSRACRGRDRRSGRAHRPFSRRFRVMGDAFDEFMRELERRRRQAMGEDPDTEPDADERSEPRGPTPLDDQPRGGRGPSDAGGSGRRGGGPGGPAGPGGSGSGGAGGGTGGGPIRGPRRRQPGVRGFMRRYAIAIIGISVLVVLFLVGLVVAGVFLLGNLWLAGRLIPKVTVGPGPLRGWAERLADASGQGGVGGRARDARGRDDPRSPAFVFDAGEIPDFTPFAGALLTGFAILVTLGVAAALAADWAQI